MAECFFVHARQGAQSRSFDLMAATRFGSIRLVKIACFAPAARQPRAFSSRRYGYRLLQHSEISAAPLGTGGVLAAACQAVAEGIVAALRRNLGPNTTDHVSTGADGELLLDFTRLTREQAAAICELIDR